MKVSDMDLLDYFASQALSCVPNDQYYLDTENGKQEAQKAAESCYNLAEAMLVERQKRKETPI